MNLWQRIRPFFLLFMMIESITRVVFLVKEHGHLSGVMGIIKSLAMGFVFDAAVSLYFMIPVVLYVLSLPANYDYTRLSRIINGILFGLLAYVMLFTSVSEWFFWDEFTARFNFIAVDYLVYTHEVIGNITESYPIYPLLAAIAVLSAAMGYVYGKRPLPFYQTAQRPTLAKNALAKRALAGGSYAVLTILAFFTVNTGLAEISHNRFENEIAKNGIFELFSAYRHNELNYAQFYHTLQDEKPLLTQIRTEINGNQQRFLDNGITHQINVPEPEQRYNIIMVTVESLSADFLGVFGNKDGLTPYLDHLAGESLLFTDLYATGTRTVYGLSALTLSIPPLPGNAIARRPHNEQLFSLGSVLNSKGYVSKFIYGGYGYFDNMNYFFKNNGYRIVDRTAMDSSEITFSNIWGVADENLFHRVIKENDKAHAQGTPFFDMVMTTSNHRPFTYPDGKIDIPSHSGRKGGVKYTDYAIRQLIETSRTRPWFNNTLFVIVADHTAGGAGKMELDPAAYHIPMLVYAPAIIKPGKMEKMMSQIDVAPTLLGLLNMDYESRFYGRDVLREPLERALISNYQQLGYLTKDNLLIMKPVKQLSLYSRQNGQFVLQPQANTLLEQTALSYYQNANHWKEWNKGIYYPEKPAGTETHANLAH